MNRPPLSGAFSLQGSEPFLVFIYQSLVRKVLDDFVLFSLKRLKDSFSILFFKIDSICLQVSSHEAVATSARRMSISLVIPEREDGSVYIVRAIAFFPRHHRSTVASNVTPLVSSGAPDPLRVDFVELPSEGCFFWLFDVINYTPCYQVLPEFALCSRMRAVLLCDSPLR